MEAAVLISLGALIIAVFSAGVAVSSAVSSGRSADAAEKSVTESRRSADAAEKSVTESCRSADAAEQSAEEAKEANHLARKPQVHSECDGVYVANGLSLFLRPMTDLTAMQVDLIAYHYNDRRDATNWLIADPMAGQASRQEGNTYFFGPLKMGESAALLWRSQFTNLPRTLRFVFKVTCIRGEDRWEVPVDTGTLKIESDPFH